jgi:hypothetical protein
MVAAKIVTLMLNKIKGLPQIVICGDKNCHWIYVKSKA